MTAVAVPLNDVLFNPVLTFDSVFSVEEFSFVGGLVAVVDRRLFVISLESLFVIFDGADIGLFGASVVLGFSSGLLDGFGFGARLVRVAKLTAGLGGGALLVDDDTVFLTALLNDGLRGGAVFAAEASPFVNDLVGLGEVTEDAVAGLAFNGDAGLVNGFDAVDVVVLVVVVVDGFAARLVRVVGVVDLLTAGRDVNVLFTGVVLGGAVAAGFLAAAVLAADFSVVAGAVLGFMVVGAFVVGLLGALGFSSNGFLMTDFLGASFFSCAMATPAATAAAAPTAAAAAAVAAVTAAALLSCSWLILSTASAMLTAFSCRFCEAADDGGGVEILTFVLSSVGSLISSFSTLEDTSGTDMSPFETKAFLADSASALLSLTCSSTFTSFRVGSLGLLKLQSIDWKSPASCEDGCSNRLHVKSPPNPKSNSTPLLPDSRNSDSNLSLSIADFS